MAEVMSDESNELPSDPEEQLFGKLVINLLPITKCSVVEAACFGGSGSRLINFGGSGYVSLNVRQCCGAGS